MSGYLSPESRGEYERHVAISRALGHLWRCPRGECHVTEVHGALARAFDWRCGRCQAALEHVPACRPYLRRVQLFERTSEDQLARLDAEAREGLVEWTKARRAEA